MKNLNKIGQFLKESREKKGLTLNDVAINLKISARILKAIEEGAQQQLPPRTFLRGFIQSYANFLKLDTDSILKIFNEDAKFDDATASAETFPAMTQSATITTQELSTVVAKADATSKSSKEILQEKDGWSLPIKIGMGIGFFVLLFLIVFLKKIIDKYEKESQVEPTVSAELSITPIPTVEPSSSEQNDKKIVSPDEIEVIAHQDSPTKQHTSPIPSVSPQAGIISKLSPAPTPKLLTSIKPVATISPSVSLSPKASLVTKPSPAPLATVAPKTSIVPKLTGVQKITVTPSPSKTTVTPITSPKPTLVAKPTLVPSPTAIPKLSVTPKAQISPKPSITPGVGETLKPSLTPKPSPLAKPSGVPGVNVTPKPMKAVPQEVMVEALDKIEIEFSVDSGQKTKIVLAPGQIHVFKAKAKVDLQLSDGGAANIVHNGKEKGVPGDLGKSITLSFK